MNPMMLQQAMALFWPEDRLYRPEMPKQTNNQQPNKPKNGKKEKVK
ncbi:MAG: hypothetical protein AB1424_08975 [Thermodesulfobacteriota bacterium]